MPKFQGYDSFDALYVSSQLKLNVTKAATPDPDTEADVDKLLRAVYRLIEKELDWSRLCLLRRKAEGSLYSRGIWKLPDGRGGEAYLDGIAKIATWDEYAALSSMIDQWSVNLNRSAGFNPVRIPEQEHGADKDTGPEIVIKSGDAVANKRIQFKNDLVIAFDGDNGLPRIRYVPERQYTEKKVTGMYGFAETLAKNGVTMADVNAQAAKRVGSDHAFRFVNLRGLQAKTEWT